MKKILLIILFHLFTSLSFAQNTNKLDSLFNSLKIQQDDTNKVRTYFRICNNVVFNNAQLAVENVEQGLRLAEKIKWERGIALGYTFTGDAYENLQDHTKALEFRFKALKKWGEIKDKVKICGTLSNIGVSYDYLGNKLKALEYYILALKLSKEIANDQTIVNNTLNIGTIYFEQENYDKALEYLFEALKTAEKNHFENSISFIEANIGQCYSNQGKIALSIAYQTRALETNDKLGYKKNAAMLVVNLGCAFSFRGDSAKTMGNTVVSKKNYGLSIEYFLNAKQRAEELKDTLLLMGVYRFLGGIKLLLEKYDEASDYFQKSLAFASKLDNHNERAQCYKGLSGIAKARNNLKMALDFQERFFMLQDSIFKENNKQAISDLQIKYETEKKETENKALAKQNEVQNLTISNSRYLIFSLSGSLLLVLALAFLFIRQNKIKSQQLAIQFEQKLLRTQMNPHFIYNSLASIESYIYENNPKEAANYLTRFSRLMRLILENSSSEFITLEKEIEILEYYLSLQKLRLDEKLDYTIEIEKNIQQSQVYLPPMLTQPFIENAIEHGFRGLKEKGLIKIAFELADNYLTVQITDNGIGLARALEQKETYKNSKSLALQITQERLNLLNKIKKQKVKFEVSDLIGKNGESGGTKVVFSIPI